MMIRPLSFVVSGGSADQNQTEAHHSAGLSVRQDLSLPHRQLYVLPEPYPQA